MLLPTGCERRKAPEAVRAALIEAAARLLAEQGLSRLTVDAVARAAGVTKGGLFHHFPTKNDLIRGVIAAMIDTASVTIDARMAQDPEPHGRFTRAYLDGVFSDHQLAGQVSARALCLAILADPDLQGVWSDWVAGRVAVHAATDDNPSCALARFAADGIWLNSLRNEGRPDALPPDLRATLVALTRPDA